MTIRQLVKKLDQGTLRTLALKVGEMPMTTCETSRRPERPAVPIELGGKWIAWTFDGTRIVAHGETLDECEKAAAKAGEKNPRFEKTPRPDVRIIGIAK